ncbi:MAG TPA: hypothetical protein VFO38_04585 [Candidatus Saccharimonadales bacterium]|nr:hypothetical protein [Candidatus Saccharimonadales bacterium]
MRFKPFSEKYDFTKSELTEHYPLYLRRPIAQWFHDLVAENELGYFTNSYISRISGLKPGFVNNLNTIFRENFPTDLQDFIKKIFSDADLTSNFLALLLQNICKGVDAVRLEMILSNGGSAFAVEKVDKSANSYDAGVYDLVKRVPEVVAKQAAEALTSNELIKEAWNACYSRNPDYERTVNRCCDALEHMLRDKYESKNVKPQLGMLIKNLQTTPGKLSFKGDTLLRNKADLMSLVSSATQVRGSHTAGTGRKPTSEEAEFILHSTILIWNVHQAI